VRSTLRALIVLHRTYRTLPAGARLHTLIRFLTCPFVRVMKHVPGSVASMLEIGAGHGVFSRLAAARGVSRVVAVEPDLRKVVIAPHVEGVSFVAGFDDVVGGTFDCVAIIDVLYTIPLEQWDAILARAARRLPAGGTLLIKEQDPEARLKNSWNRVQEWFTQKILRLTLANAFSYESIPTFTKRLETHGFSRVVARRVDFGYPHPHLLYVATKR
jgi:cyclopropane fatty-acyl-phospholipid synthase-like methyltransferase